MSSQNQLRKNLTDELADTFEQIDNFDARPDPRLILYLYNFSKTEIGWYLAKVVTVAGEEYADWFNGDEPKVVKLKVEKYVTPQRTLKTGAWTYVKYKKAPEVILPRLGDKIRDDAEPEEEEREVTDRYLLKRQYVVIRKGDDWTIKNVKEIITQDDLGVDEEEKENLYWVKYIADDRAVQYAVENDWFFVKDPDFQSPADAPAVLSDEEKVKLDVFKVKFQVAKLADDFIRKNGALKDIGGYEFIAQCHVDKDGHRVWYAGQISKQINRRVAWIYPDEELPGPIALDWTHYQSNLSIPEDFYKDREPWTFLNVEQPLQTPSIHSILEEYDFLDIKNPRFDENGELILKFYKLIAYREEDKWHAEEIINGRIQIVGSSIAVESVLFDYNWINTNNEKRFTFAPEYSWFFIKNKGAADVEDEVEIPQSEDDDDYEKDPDYSADENKKNRKSNEQKKVAKARKEKAKANRDAEFHPEPVYSGDIAYTGLVEWVFDKKKLRCGKFRTETTAGEVAVGATIAFQRSADGVVRCFFAKVESIHENIISVRCVNDDGHEETVEMDVKYAYIVPYALESLPPPREASRHHVETTRGDDEARDEISWERARELVALQSGQKCAVDMRRVLETSVDEESGALDVAGKKSGDVLVDAAFDAKKSGAVAMQPMPEWRVEELAYEIRKWVNRKIEHTARLGGKRDPVRRVCGTIVGVFFGGDARRSPPTYVVEWHGDGSVAGEFNITGRRNLQYNTHDVAELGAPKIISRHKDEEAAWSWEANVADPHRRWEDGDQRVQCAATIVMKQMFYAGVHSVDHDFRIVTLEFSEHYARLHGGRYRAFSEEAAEAAKINLALNRDAALKLSIEVDDGGMSIEPERPWYEYPEKRAVYNELIAYLFHKGLRTSEWLDTEDGRSIRNPDDESALPDADHGARGVPPTLVGAGPGALVGADTPSGSTLAGGGGTPPAGTPASSSLTAVSAEESDEVESEKKDGSYTVVLGQLRGALWLHERLLKRLGEESPYRRPDAVVEDIETPLGEIVVQMRRAIHHADWVFPPYVKDAMMKKKKQDEESALLDTGADDESDMPSMGFPSRAMFGWSSMKSTVGTAWRGVDEFKVFGRFTALHKVNADDAGEVSAARLDIKFESIDSEDTQADAMKKNLAFFFGEPSRIDGGGQYRYAKVGYLKMSDGLNSVFHSSIMNGAQLSSIYSTIGVRAHMRFTMHALVRSHLQENGWKPDVRVRRAINDNTRFVRMDRIRPGVQYFSQAEILNNTETYGKDRDGNFYIREECYTFAMGRDFSVPFENYERLTMTLVDESSTTNMILCLLNKHLQELCDSGENGAKMEQWHCALVGTEYPVYNPYGLFAKRAGGQCLLQQTQMDGLFLVYQGEYGRDTKGYLVTFELKILMETSNPEDVVTDKKAQHQVFANAVMFEAAVGVRPTWAVVVHATRRGARGPYTAYGTAIRTKPFQDVSDAVKSTGVAGGASTAASGADGSAATKAAIKTKRENFNKAAAAVFDNTILCPLGKSPKVLTLLCDGSVFGAVDVANAPAYFHLLKDARFLDTYQSKITDAARTGAAGYERVDEDKSGILVYKKKAAPWTRDDCRREVPWDRGVRILEFADDPEPEPEEIGEPPGGPAAEVRFEFPDEDDDTRRRALLGIRPAPDETLLVRLPRSIRQRAKWPATEHLRAELNSAVLQSARRLASVIGRVDKRRLRDAERFLQSARKPVRFADGAVVSFPAASAHRTLQDALVSSIQGILNRIVLEHFNDPTTVKSTDAVGSLTFRELYENVYIHGLRPFWTVDAAQWAIDEGFEIAERRLQQLVAQWLEET